MKKIFLIAILVLSSFQLFSQKVVNYDKNGDKLKSVTEYVDISIMNTPSNKVPAGPTSLPGVILGPVYNIVSTAIKNGLEKRQKSFTASYSNTSEFLAEEFKEPGLKSLLIKRYAINSLDDVDDKHLMAEYLLTLTPETNSLSIELKTILLKKSKARYRRDDNLSIAINVKATSTQSGKKESAAKDEKTENKSTDGEGTITIPIIRVTGNNQDFTGKTNVINKIKLNGISLSTSNSIKFAVTITEANITHIDPSKIQTIILNNSSDIQTILKAIFGVSEK